MEFEGFYQLGGVITAHGIRGELRIKPLTNLIEEYLDLENLFLVVDRELKEFSIEKIRLNGKGQWLIKLKGFNDRNYAESLKGVGVYVRDEDIVPLEDDEYFIHELIGATVYDTNDEELGKIVNYFETAASGICEVETKDQEIFLFPATHEVLIDVLPEEQKVIINPLPGLVELNRKKK
ncbi:MAG: 16S rRNA processing protein RimM [bacterium]|jgi:16S rRNA processing protein RimM